MELPITITVSSLSEKNKQKPTDKLDIISRPFFLKKKKSSHYFARKDGFYGIANPEYFH